MNSWPFIFAVIIVFLDLFAAHTSTNALSIQPTEVDAYGDDSYGGNGSDDDDAATPGEIAGIVIGVLGGIFIVFLVLYLCIWNRCTTEIGETANDVSGKNNISIELADKDPDTA